MTPKPPKVPTIGELESRVKLLATQSSESVCMLLPHFRNRMRVRNISMRQVLEVLRNGYATGRPRRDPQGGYRITMRRKVAGRRVTVVVAVCSGHVECITAW